MKWARASTGVVVVLVALAVVVPFVGLRVPWVLPGTVDVVNSTGTLGVLALCFLFAAVAVGYDILYGANGLLSLGAVLFFGEGVYVFDIAVTHWAWPLAMALVFTLGCVLVSSLILGAVSLRVGGIAFSMVTLAFAQAFYYLIEDNPHGLTGGDSGLALNSTRLPSFLSGAVSQTRYVYWVALGFLLITYLVVFVVSESSVGHVWRALRDNSLRLEVLGLRPFGYRLGAFVLSSLIAAAGGVVYVLVIGTAVPSAVASTTLTISLLVMVVLGGTGSRGGVVAGGVAYVYLQQLLLKVASEPSFGSLPAPLRVPLSQPQFLLGALFVLFVVFVPGGFAGALVRLSRRRTPRIDEMTRGEGTTDAAG